MVEEHLGRGLEHKDCPFGPDGTRLAPKVTLEKQTVYIDLFREMPTEEPSPENTCPIHRFLEEAIERPDEFVIKRGTCSRCKVSFRGVLSVNKPIYPDSPKK